MIMQERDMKILEFMTQVRYCTNENIQDVFFQGLNHNVCYRRLNYLIDCKLIKRKYYHVDNKNIYVYYLDKKPSKRLLQHELLVTQFLVSLIKQGYELLSFEKTPRVSDIIPDGVISFKSGNKVRQLFLEVQLSSGDCILKYSNIKNKVSYDIPSTLYIITNQQMKYTKIRGLDIIIDDLNFSKLKGGIFQ